MRDPYEVLGVPRGASAAAIKSAYRKLAKKHHPDANNNDPKAAARFSELNSANEIIGDEDKRKQFDRGEIDAEGKPRFQGFPGGDRAAVPAGRAAGSRPTPSAPAAAPAAAGRGFEDILNSMFGGGARGGRPGGGSSLRIRDRRHRARSRSERRHDGVAGRVGQGRGEARPAADRQGAQCQDSGRRDRGPADPAEGPGRDRARPPARRSPDHGQHRAACRSSRSTAAICASICRSRCMKRCSAARCGCRRSAARSNCRSRKTPPAAAPSASRARGCRRRAGAGDLFVTTRIILPDGNDAELEALMEKWRDGHRYNPRSDFG